MKALFSLLLILLFNWFGFSQDHFAFKKEGKFGIIDSKGKVTCQPTYSFMYRANSQRFFASKNGIWSYLNNRGEQVGEFRFSGFYRVNDQVSCVKKNGYWGVFNTQFDSVLVAYQFETITNKSNFIVGERNDSTFFYSISGRLLHATKEETKVELRKDKESVYLVKGGKRALIENGTTELNWFDRWKSFKLFNLGVSGNKDYLVGKSGKLFSTNRALTHYSTFLFSIVSTEKNSYVFDQYGNQWTLPGIVKVKIVSSQYFETVDTLGKFGIFDYVNNKIELPNKYRSIIALPSIKIVEDDNSKFELLDADYSLLKNTAFDDVSVINNDFLYVNINGKWGVYSVPKKKVIIPTRYDWIEYELKGASKVRNGNKMGLVWSNGKVLVPCKAKSIDIKKDMYKAYLNNDVMEVYYHNGRGTITEKSTFNNVVSAQVDIVRRTQRKRFEGSNPSNFRYFFNSKYNSTSRREISKSYGWFNNELDTNAVRNELVVWGIRDTNQKVRSKPTTIMDTYLMDSTHSIVVRYRTKTLSLKPLVQETYYYTKVYDHRRYKYRPVTVHTLNKNDVISSSPVILGYYDYNFYLFDKHKFKKVDTFSYVSPLFNSTYRFVSKNGSLIQCKESNPDRVSSIFNFRNFLHDFDSIDPRDFERSKFQYHIDQISTGKKFRGNHLYVRKGKFGIYDTAWRLIVPVKYDFIYPYEANVFIVKNNNKKGLITIDSVVFPIRYKQVNRLRSPKDSLFMFSNPNNSFNLIDKNGEILQELPSVIDYEAISGEKVKVRTRKGWGLYDFESKSMLLPAEYSRIDQLSNGLLKLRKRKNIGIADLEGIIRVEPRKYKSILPLSQGFYSIENGRKKHAVFNENGDTVLPFDYSSIIYKDKYIIAIKANSFEIYSDSLKLIKTMKLRFELFNGELIAGSKKGKTKIYDFQSGKYIKGKFENIICLGNKEFFMSRNKYLLRYSLVSNSIVDTLFDWKKVEPFTRKTYIAKGAENKKWYVVDTNFNKISRYRERKIQILSERYFSYFGSGGSYIFDRRKDSIIPLEQPIYKVLGYSQGLFLCINNRKAQMYFDTTGRLVFNQSFSKASEYKNDLALIKDQNSYCIQDLNGTLVNMFPQYTNMKRISPTKFLARKSILYGVVDNKGNVLIPNEYSRLNLIDDNWIQAYKDDTITYYNLKTRKWLVK